MKLKEAAEFLGVSITTIWRWSRKIGISMQPHQGRCQGTVDMFSGNTEGDDILQHDGRVIGLLYQEKRKRMEKRKGC